MDDNINYKREADKQMNRALDNYRGFGPGENDILVWGPAIGALIGGIRSHGLDGVLIWAAGGLGVAIVIRVLRGLASRG
jgi:hypothetical protein